MASFSLPLDWLEEWKNSKVLAESQVKDVLWGIVLYADGREYVSEDAVVNAFISAYKPQVDRIKNYRENMAGPGRRTLIPEIYQGMISQMRREGKSARLIAEFLNKEYGLNVKADNVFHSAGWKL